MDTTVLLLWKDGRVEAHPLSGKPPSTLEVPLFQLVHQLSAIDPQDTLPIIKWVVKFIRVENASLGQLCYEEANSEWKNLRSL